MGPVIAVTGASGQIGGRVARRLAEAGTAQRLVGRDASRLPDFDGAVKAPPASYDDGAAMRRALEGADTLFLVSARESADRVREHITAVDAAVAVGIRRIVYVSFQSAAPDATFTFARDHWHTEQHIRDTGLRHTFLRDSLYLAVLPAMVGAYGAIRGPGGQGRIAAVAHDDIADAAAAVLLGGDAHDHLTYDLTGPEAITLAEAAAVLTRFTGRLIEYIAESRDQAYASRAQYNAPAWEMAGWVTSYEAIATGEMAKVSTAIPMLTGRPAQNLAGYLTTHPQAWEHLKA